jgi:hypothetical protein
MVNFLPGEKILFIYRGYGMNKVFIRGLVENIKKFNSDKGKYVAVKVSFWGFSHTFFVDVNDDLLDYLTTNQVYDFEGVLYKNKYGLNVRLLGVKEADDR